MSGVQPCLSRTSASAPGRLSRKCSTRKCPPITARCIACAPMALAVLVSVSTSGCAASQRNAVSAPFHAAMSHGVKPCRLPEESWFRSACLAADDDGVHAPPAPPSTSSALFVAWSTKRVTTSMLSAATASRKLMLAVKEGCSTKAGAAVCGGGAEARALVTPRALMRPREDSTSEVGSAAARSSGVLPGPLAMVAPCARPPRRGRRMADGG